MNRRRRKPSGFITDRSLIRMNEKTIYFTNILPSFQTFYLITVIILPGYVDSQDINNLSFTRTLQRNIVDSHWFRSINRIPQSYPERDLSIFLHRQFHLRINNPLRMIKIINSHSITRYPVGQLTCHLSLAVFTDFFRDIYSGSARCSFQRFYITMGCRQDCFISIVHLLKSNIRSIGYHAYSRPGNCDDPIISRSKNRHFQIFLCCPRNIYERLTIRRNLPLVMFISFRTRQSYCFSPAQYRPLLRHNQQWRQTGHA